MTAIVIIQIGLIDEIYVFDDCDTAEKQAVVFANQYFNNYVDGKLTPFETFEDVDVFQYKYDTGSIEIKMMDVSDNPVEEEK